MGGGVTTQTVAGAKTDGDSPNYVRLYLQLRQSRRDVGYKCRTAQCNLEEKETKTFGNTVKHLRSR